MVVSYFPALQGGFVWDDVIFSEEPVIHSPAGLRSIWLAPADIKNEGHYWPLVYTSFWLEHKIWGLNPVGYHAVNILLHLVNCLLLWRLLDRLAIPGAIVVAAVFAVHPMHVESVAWIIERKDVLSALFYLTAVLVWIRFDESPGPGRYGEAVANYRAALAIDAEFAPAHAGLGIALFQWEHYEESIDALERALALESDLPIAGSSPYVFLGRAAQQLGRPDAAQYFARALQHDPHDHEALDHLAMVRFGQQRYEEAYALYRTMVQINPDSAVTHSNLGAALYHLGRFEQALESIERSLALDPDLENARIGRELVTRELAQRAR